MTVTPLEHSGNSAKFTITTKRGDFIVAISRTLRANIWQLADADAELQAATELAEAIVSRHDPKLPFKKVYVFGEHNSEPELQRAVTRIRKYGYESQVA